MANGVYTVNASNGSDPLASHSITVCSFSLSSGPVRLMQAPEVGSSSITVVNSCALGTPVVDILCPGCTCDSSKTATANSISFNADCPAGSQPLTFTIHDHSTVNMPLSVTFCSITIPTTLVKSIQAPASSAYSISASDSCGIGAYVADVSCSIDCTCPATASATADDPSFSANCPAGTKSLTLTIQGNTQITTTQSVTFCAISLSPAVV